MKFKWEDKLIGLDILRGDTVVVFKIIKNKKKIIITKIKAVLKK